MSRNSSFYHPQKQRTPHCPSCILGFGCWRRYRNFDLRLFFQWFGRQEPWLWWAEIWWKEYLFRGPWDHWDWRIFSWGGWHFFDRTPRCKRPLFKIGQWCVFIRPLHLWFWCCVWQNIQLFWITSDLWSHRDLIYHRFLSRRSRGCCVRWMIPWLSDGNDVIGTCGGLVDFFG